MNAGERMEWMRQKFSEIAQRQAEIEAEIGVVPLEYAHSKRRDARRKLAPLETLFGQAGTYEERRKAFRSKVATEIEASIREEIAEAVQAAEKIDDEKARKAALAAVRKDPSETELDRLASGHPSYVRFIKTATRMKRQYNEIKDAAKEWEETINRGQAIARYVAGTPHAAGEES